MTKVLRLFCYLTCACSRFIACDTGSLSKGPYSYAETRQQASVGAHSFDAEALILAALEKMEIVTGCRRGDAPSCGHPDSVANVSSVDEFLKDYLHTDQATLSRLSTQGKSREKSDKSPIRCFDYQKTRMCSNSIPMDF